MPPSHLETAPIEMNKTNQRASKSLFNKPDWGGRASSRALTSVPSPRTFGLARTLALPNRHFQTGTNRSPQSRGGTAALRWPGDRIRRGAAPIPPASKFHSKSHTAIL